MIAALLAVAGRLGAQEAEAAAALWSAAGSSGSGSAAAAPLEALLTLDTTTQLGQGSGRWVLGQWHCISAPEMSLLAQPQYMKLLRLLTRFCRHHQPCPAAPLLPCRLSTLGCAMAGTLLRLPAAACKQWADAVAALPPGQLQHVAKDPGGCRVLEAYLEVNAVVLRVLSAFGCRHGIDRCSGAGLRKHYQQERSSRAFRLWGENLTWCLVLAGYTLHPLPPAIRAPARRPRNGGRCCAAWRAPGATLRWVAAAATLWRRRMRWR